MLVMISGIRAMPDRKQPILGQWTMQLCLGVGNYIIMIASYVIILL